MKVFANRHVGILVHDIDKMISFYAGLGMVIKGSGVVVEKGEFIEELLNSEGVVLETVKLTIEDNNIPERLWFVLELMSLNNEHNLNYSNNESHLNQFIINNCKSGVLDIAFTVDDISEVCDYVLSKGGDIISKPIKAPAGYPALHCYLRDPEGNVLHMAENLPI